MYMAILNKALKWIRNNIKTIIFGIFVCIVIVFLYICKENIRERKDNVTVMPESKAETIQGVKDAAINIGVTVDEGQVKETAGDIREIVAEDVAPEITILSSGEKWREDSEKVRIENGADFAIVTPASNTAAIDDVKPDDKVELNQYNIHAYKKQLNTVSYAPQEKVVGYEHQWKVSKDGRYIGVGIDHDIDDQKTYFKVTYSW